MNNLGLYIPIIQQNNYFCQNTTGKIVTKCKNDLPTQWPTSLTNLCNVGGVAQ